MAKILIRIGEVFMKRVIFVILLLCVVLMPILNLNAEAADAAQQKLAQSGSGNDSRETYYDFISVEQLVAKFKEIRSLDKSTHYYIDDFFANEIIYFPPESPLLEDGFETITVYQNCMSVDYKIDGKRFRFNFYPPNGHEETGEQFFTNHILNKENLKETVDFEGIKIYRADYYNSDVVIYAWIQDDIYFSWYQYDPDLSDISIEKFAAICKAIPYAIDVDKIDGVNNNANPSTGR